MPWQYWRMEELLAMYMYMLPVFAKHSRYSLGTRFSLCRRRVWPTAHTRAVLASHNYSGKLDYSSESLVLVLQLDSSHRPQDYTAASGNQWTRLLPPAARLHGSLRKPSKISEKGQDQFSSYFLHTNTTLATRVHVPELQYHKPARVARGEVK